MSDEPNPIAIPDLQALISERRKLLNQIDVLQPPPPKPSPPAEGETDPDPRTGEVVLPPVLKISAGEDAPSLLSGGEKTYPISEELSERVRFMVLEEWCARVTEIDGRLAQVRGVIA